MDCFYAAVEMRDDPKLRNVPIAIGGTSRRSVLCTANYEARKYGVSSAMPTSMALKKCPHLIVVNGNMHKYKDASIQIRKIFHEYTDMVEPLSLDEAFLDVTDCERCQGSATLIAKEIQHKIFERTQLTASAGVAPNKFLAKVASDWRKPNGIFVITPNAVKDFVVDLPVTKIFGVGKVTGEKLKGFGITTCGDVLKKDPLLILDNFGKLGPNLIDYAKGIDNREVISHRARKSFSIEETYEYDLENLEQCLEQLPRLFKEMSLRFSKWHEKAKAPPPICKAYVKVKFCDFKSVTVEKCKEDSFFYPFSKSFEIEGELEELFKTLLIMGHERHKIAVRLLGIGFKLSDNEQIKPQHQLELPLARTLK